MPRSLNGSPLHMLCHYLIMACIVNGCLLQRCTPCPSTYACKRDMISRLKDWAKKGLWGKWSHQRQVTTSCFFFILSWNYLCQWWYIGQSLSEKWFSTWWRSVKHWHRNKKLKIDGARMFFCRPWPREGLWAAGRALIDAVQICQRWKSGVDIFLVF